MKKSFILIILLCTGILISCNNIFLSRKNANINFSFDKITFENKKSFENIPEDAEIKIICEVEGAGLQPIIKTIKKNELTNCTFKIDNLDLEKKYKIKITMVCNDKLQYVGASDFIELTKKNKFQKVVVELKKCQELTTEVITLPEGTTGSQGTAKTYVYFGDWPQSVKTDDVFIDETSSYKINNWNCYLGDDGYFYVKEVANPFKNWGKFTNGVSLKKGESYYFKLEPIKWIILTENYGDSSSNGILLFAENVLTCKNFYNDWKHIRNINNLQINPNNYKYSIVRAFLNGLDGSKWGNEKDNPGNYNGKGFLDYAFSEKGLNNIKKVTVKNDLSSTTDTENANVCGNTLDKVFLLSKQEIIDSTYGFLDERTNDSSRIRQVTDYSIAKGSNMKTTIEEKNNNYYFLRSPSKSGEGDVYRVSSNGDARNILTANENAAGIVPAIVVNK